MISRKTLPQSSYPPYYHIPHCLSSLLSSEKIVYANNKMEAVWLIKEVDKAITVL